MKSMIHPKISKFEGWKGKIVFFRGGREVVIFKKYYGDKSWNQD